MKIGYLGPRGTFSEQAAISYGKNISAPEYMPFETIYDVMDAVCAQVVEEGIVPLENSIEGTVTSTIDKLIFHDALFIKAEIVIAVCEDMLVNIRYENEPIRKILSHPQALSQCTRFVRKHYPKSEMVPVSSTAEAAKMVAQGGAGLACLSPRQAAEIYGLKALYQNVQDEDGNATRFVIITNKQTPVLAKNHKTSIVFATKHKPGELYRILDILAIWDINMTKIESRPSKHQLGEYVFFVDMEAENLEDLNAALNMIARKSAYFKFLGSYPEME